MKSLVDELQPIQNLNILRHIFPADETFPNNGLLPLLVYKNVFTSIAHGETDSIKELLETNSWKASWIDGIYDYHHYHSTAHEALVVLDGTAHVQFGGPNGITFPLETGDVVIIPAGVAHRRIVDADGFSCLGAYPDNQQYDMNYGKKEEFVKASKNIRSLPLPENDPLYGNDGPLVKNWFPEKDHTIPPVS